MSKNAIIALIVIIVAVAGGYFLFTRSQQPTTSTTQSDQPSNQTDNATSGSTSQEPGAGGTGGTSGAGTFSMTEVSAHASATSCWTVIDGNVYDVTSWIPQHPGGPAAIKQLCGVDGTALFHGQHGDAQRQADILATMKIGVLAR